MFKGFKIGDRLINLHCVLWASLNPAGNAVVFVKMVDQGDISVPATDGAALYTALVAL